VSENQSIVDVKTAVYAAYQYLRSLQEVMGGTLYNLRLEEVELSEDRDFWLVTVGFDRAEFPAIMTEDRNYKIFKVNSQTGEVEAMKIRAI